MKPSNLKFRFFGIYDKPIPIMVVSTVFVVLVCISLVKWRTDAWLHSIGVVLLVIGLGLLGFRMIWDIRLRLSTQERLAESEARLRGLTDHLPTLVSYIDRAERFQFNNRPYEKWL